MSRMLVTVAVGIALAIPAASYACSKAGFRGVRSPNVAHFIGTSTADTVLAGAGSVRYEVAGGGSAPDGGRAVFGQVISVERMGGLASRALRQPLRQVVLVPWAYGADCVPIHWARSVRWLEPGTRGLFTGVLRDSAHWAGGVPTFDVFTPEWEPYPRQVQRQARNRRLSPDSIVPIEELLQLIELFPDHRLLPDSAEAATAQLFAWARANPTLTRRYPIADVLSQARSAVGRQRLRAIKSPATGTWQMTLSLSGSPVRTFYARTRGVPTTEWFNGVLRPRPDDPTVVPRPDGYHLLAAVAESLAALPQSCERGREMRREAYIVVADPPRVSTSDARRWRGKLEVGLAARAFAADTALAQFARDEFETFRRRTRGELSEEAPAHFAQSADGTIRVKQTITLVNGRSLTITGKRVSPDIVACRG